MVSSRVVSCKKLHFFMLTFLSLTTYNLQLVHADANVSAEVRALRSSIRIGDEVRLLLTVEHPRKYSVTFPSEKINVSPFEVKNVDPEVIRKGQNRVRETFRLTLTVFQIGDLKVPPITVQYTDDAGNPGQVATEPLSVKVASIGKKITDKDDIRSIKKPVSIGLFGFWSTLASIVAGMLTIFLIVKIIVRRWRDRNNAENRKPPHERVKIEIGRLKDHGYLEEKNYKAFYSEFSNILRRYLERRFQVEALESTSAELVEELKGISLEKEVLEAVREVLTEADFVKFAKSTPSYELAGHLEALLLDTVERTKPQAEEKKRGVEG